jgi:2-polyprenyl-3-methyl-5-hydroxy-6-metoxy-1,4-benzoquinol methylase
MFVIDPPERLGDYYTSDYHSRPLSADDLEPLLPGSQFKLDLIRQFKSGGSLLEIGPSSGAMCVLAKRAGFDVSAMELDPDCVAFMRDIFKIRAIQTATPARVIADEGRMYDVICLWHSIEHMEAPWDVLATAARHLRPGGVLIVAAPNPDCWQAKILGARWAHYDLPRHLFEIPAGWLRAFSNRHQLQEIFFTTNDPASRHYTSFSWRRFLELLTRDAQFKRILWRVGGVFARLLAPWERREGNGAAYVMVLSHPHLGQA